MTTGGDLNGYLWQRVRYGGRRRLLYRQGKIEADDGSKFPVMGRESLWL